MPPRLKLRGSVEKYLLKEAVRDLLSRTIVERPKSGMLVTVGGGGSRGRCWGGQGAAAGRPPGRLL